MLSMVLAEAGLKRTQARVVGGDTGSCATWPDSLGAVDAGLSMGQQFTAPRVVKGVKLNKLVAVLRLVLVKRHEPRIIAHWWLHRRYRHHLYLPNPACLCSRDRSIRRSG